MARRRKFNPTGGQIALAAGAAIIGLLAVSQAMAKPVVTKKKKKEIGEGTKEDEKKGPDPDEEEKRIADELLATISEDPGPSSLYLVQKGKTFAQIARDVFAAAGIPDAAQDGQARVAYMKCVSGSEFNRTLYGKKDDFTDNFPSWTSPDNVSIRSAFLNKSGDYITQLLNGRIPTKKSGSNRGLLWLPSVDVNAWNQFGKIVCVDEEPPPLMELAEEQQ